MIDLLVRTVESGHLPDALCRLGIRALLRGRLRKEDRRARRGEADAERLARELAAAPVAPSPESPNAQHYEVPLEFFQVVLGRHMKYSSCLWEPQTRDLHQAEADMLALTCARAEVEDGMRILDLGCGWGSLTLWLARHLPGARITALSNSRIQGEYIRAQVQAEGWRHVEVITADINDARLDGDFDRVLSVEMFEHMRNYAELFRRVSGWLKPDGKLFVHIFCHRRHTYAFEVEGPGDWMAKYFFTAGLMPSSSLLPRFAGTLQVEQQWHVPGTHYARTARSWLSRLDRHRRTVLEVFRDFYGPDDARLWLNRWRLFFMACEELFAYNRGMEWHVAHYRFGRSAEGD